METISELLALCVRNSPVTGWWFETPSRSLCRHCNVEKQAVLLHREANITKVVSEVTVPNKHQAISNHHVGSTISRISYESYSPTTSSHYLSQCWLIIKCVLGVIAQENIINLIWNMYSKMIFSKITATSPRGQSVTLFQAGQEVSNLFVAMYGFVF